MPSGSVIDGPVRKIAWVIVFGAFASGLDASLTNIALDRIGADLHGDLARVQWVATGYLLALAMSLPVAGRLGTRIGVGRLWLAGLVSFTVASGLCAIAPTVDSLIALRVVQGLAGGLLIPAGQTVLGQAVGSERLGRVMASLGIAVSAAPAMGPVIGGLILDTASWRWLFAINIPVGVIGLALGLRVIPRGDRRTGRPLDWLALGCISAGLPLVVYGLSEWGSRGSLLRAAVLLPLATGVICLVAFVRRTLHRSDPLLDLGLYANRVYAAATVASGTTGMAMFGGALLFPLYFQIGHGYGTVGTGLRLLGLGGATMLTLPLTGRLIDRYGGGIVSCLGCLAVLIVASAFAVIPLDAHPVVIQALLTLMGMAVPMAAVPAGVAAYKTVRPEKLPDATTQVNIVQRVGGSLGGMLFSLTLAGGLQNGPESAFHKAFWALTATALVGVAATTWLARADRAASGSAGLHRGETRTPARPLR